MRVDKAGYLMTVTLMLALALQASACHPYMRHCERWDYDTLMSVCGYDPDDPTSGYLMGRSEYTVSVECVEAISQHYCVDWRSFDEEPQAFDYPYTVGQNLIASLLTISGTTAGPMTPEALIHAPAEVKRYASYQPAGVGFGETMFGYTTRAIETIRYEDGKSWDSMGSYREGLVKIGGEDIDWTDGISHHLGSVGATNVGLISQVLVHEAAHFVYPDHPGCDLEPEPPDCDPTIEGAYGVASWWAITWLGASLEHVYGSACDRMNFYAQRMACNRIGNHGDWPYCDDPDDYYIYCGDAWW